MKYFTSFLILMLVMAVLGCGGPELFISKDKIDLGRTKSQETFKLTNAGGGKMDWRITDDAEWVHVKPFGGRTGDDTILVIVTIDRNKLEERKYQQKINITSEGGDTTIMLTAERVPNPVVLMETSMGDIKLELFPDVAPIHVQNFLDLSRSGFYDSLIFHRVIEGFMIQAGGYTDDLKLKPAKSIPAEFNDSLHREGTLAMARMNDPNSASSQFYICLEPRPGLDGRYTVFGKTIEGLDVVHKIGKVETNRGENQVTGLMQDQPLEPIYIEKMNILVDYEPEE